MLAADEPDTALVQTLQSPGFAESIREENSIMSDPRKPAPQPQRSQPEIKSEIKRTSPAPAAGNTPAAKVAPPKPAPAKPAAAPVKRKP